MNGIMKKRLILLALAAVVALLYSNFARAAQSPDEQKQAALEIAQYEKQARKSPSGLKYVVLRQGKGDKPTRGQTIDAHYIGRFLDGRIFDQSYGRGPFTFAVGTGQVIKAWDEALMDMRLGEKRVLIVPPDLGYGKQGAGKAIPPNTTLFFEVERLR